MQDRAKRVGHAKTLLYLHNLPAGYHLVDERDEVGLIDDLREAHAVLDLPPVVEQTRKLG